jgi:hypothetical protein
MLLSVHAIEGSASAPTAEHQRRRPPTTGDRAGKQTASSSLRWQSRI